MTRKHATSNWFCASRRGKPARAAFALAALHATACHEENHYGGIDFGDSGFTDAADDEESDAENDPQSDDTTRPTRHPNTLPMPSDGTLLGPGISNFTSARILSAGFQPNGELDILWGDDGTPLPWSGTAVHDLPSWKEQLFAATGGLEVYAAGLGVFAPQTDSRLLVVKYTNTGALDPTFGGGDGTVFINHPSSAIEELRAIAAPLGETTLYATGIAVTSTGHEIIVAKLDSTTGALDNTCAGDGVFTHLFSGYAGAVGLDIAVRGDAEEFVVAGCAKTIANGECVKAGMAFFDENCNFKNQVLFDFPNKTNDAFTGVVYDANSKAVGAGIAGGDFVAGRAKFGGGTYDATFGSQGKTSINFQWGGSEGANAIATWDNKYLLAGSLNNGSAIKFAFARLNSNGSIDTTCSSDGKQTLDFPGGNAAAFDVLYDETGITLAGDTLVDTNTSNLFDIAIAKFDRWNCALDNSFGTNGSMTVDVNDDDRVMGMARNGGPVVVGWSFDFN